jgi:hypothetical protein
VTALVAFVVAAQLSPPCAAARLAGTFATVPGSAGAGQITYALTLRNTSTGACFVTGIPALTLLDRYGRRLPTHVVPAHPGELTAVRVDLAPGGRARATARFSPDVPGRGEPVGRTCEPVAYGLRVTPNGGGSLRAPLRPPTPVCEHGSMVWTVLTASR